MSARHLNARIQQYKSEHPRARLVDIARALGVSEREAVAAQVDDGLAVALRPDWEAILARVATLGPCMALTRNKYVVSECRGLYGNPKVQGSVGLVHEGNIDLRLFLSQWHSAFALRVPNPRGELKSLQFFDARGQAVHKIFLEGEDGEAAIAALIADFGQDKEALPELESAPHATQEPRWRQLTPSELEDFRSDWRKLQDTHEFHGLLKRHRVERIQALELAEPKFVRELSPKSLEEILTRARDRGMPLMAFVGNCGCIQIYSGLVQNLKRLGDWYNVLDPIFNLHVDERGLARAFLVKKPTRYGEVASLEFFSPEHELILSLFGLREDDQKASAEWSELLESIDAL